MTIATAYWSQKDSKEMLAKGSDIPFLPDGLTERWVVNLYPDRRYQEILGFGAAFTEASAYNYSRLGRENQKKIVEAYFDKERGLGYNFCRTQIHSNDFSLDEYTYTDENDEALETFSIARDRKWIIPFIKAAKEAASDLRLFTSPWSPPRWMKDNKEFNNGGKLDPAFADCWAQYIAKYLGEYGKEGLDFFGLTVQNEPLSRQTWESCQYTAEEEAVFVRDHLKPTLTKAGFGDLRIMIWDHNKERVYDRARDTLRMPGVADCVWGIAFHWYSGDHFSALAMAHEAFPDKPLILTEYCLGMSRGESTPGPHSSWDGVEIHTKELVGDFNNFMAAAVDWNMIVDDKGGPYHNRAAGTKARIVVDPEHDTVTLEPLYYAQAHFSRFIERGAVRIGSSSFSDEVAVTAFQNPDGRIVAVVLNCAERDIPVGLRLGGDIANVVLPQRSLATFVLSGINS